MTYKEKLSYAQAMKELEGIVSEIESENVDVDVLASKAKRAAYLIRYLVNLAICCYRFYFDEQSA